MGDNNYNSQDNTNPGFVTGNDTIQGQQGGMSVNSGNGFDIGQWLQSIGTSMNTPNQSGSTQGGMSISPSQQIIQDVATKAYTKQLHAHADAVPHPVLGALLDSWAANGGTKAPDNVAQGSSPVISADAAQSIAPRVGQTTPQQGQNAINAMVPPQQTQQQPSIDDQISNINKQAQLNLAKQNLSQSKPPDFLQRFYQQFSKMSGGQIQGETLQNIVSMQKIAGGEPLQPKDVGDLNANTYKAALDASHQSAALEAQKLPALVDLYGKLGENRNVLQKTLGQSSDDQKKITTALSDATSNLNTHIGNLSTLINNRPTFTSKGMDKQASDTVSKVKQGQVGKYTYR